MERAFCVWLFVVILFCYLAFGFLILASPGGSGSPQLIQPAQPYFDPDYVSPGPAEFASLSISIGTRICPLSNASGCLDVSRGRMSISALEYGPFTAGWLAYYAGTPEWVWTSPQFSGPGLILFNVSSVQVREGYQSFGFPLYVLREGKTVWVQSIDILGLDKANVKCLCLPTIKDVTFEEHKDLGGIIIHAFLSDPQSWNIIRVRIFGDGKLVYDFMKQVSIPEAWSSSPIELRVDFGPILLKKPGTYTIQVDVTSNGASDRKVVTYVKSLGASCTYHHLLLIYPCTDVTYFQSGSQQTFRGCMSDDLKETIISAFKNFAENLVKDGSGGMVSSTYDIVEIPHPVTRITSLGGDRYWLSPQDIEEDLKMYAPKGKYDSVHVVWYNGPIDSYFGLGGIFINEGTSTFSSLIAGQEWWWTGMGEALGEPFLHEWLHGVCRFYENLGCPMPEKDADGAEEHGYTKSSTEGWMRYYRDLMQGKVWEQKLSKYTGITKEAWSRGTPRGLLNVSLATVEKRILINVPDPKYTTGTTVYFIPSEFLVSHNTTIEKLVFMIDGKEVTPTINEGINGYITTFSYPKGTHTITINYVTYDIKLRVLDYSGNPLPEVALNLSGSLSRQSKTDSYGIAIISKLIPGTYNLSIPLTEIANDQTFLTATLSITNSQDITIYINKSLLESLHESYRKLNETYINLKNEHDVLKSHEEALQYSFEKLAKSYENLRTLFLVYGIISIITVAMLSLLLYKAKRSHELPTVKEAERLE